MISSLFYVLRMDAPVVLYDVSIAVCTINVNWYKSSCEIDPKSLFYGSEIVDDTPGTCDDVTDAC